MGYGMENVENLVNPFVSSGFIEVDPSKLPRSQKENNTVDKK